MFCGCCTTEELRNGEALDQDSVLQSADDMPVQARPVLKDKHDEAGKDKPGDAAAGPGKVHAPKAAKASADVQAAKERKDSKEKVKRQAQEVTARMKEGEVAFTKTEWEAAIVAYSQVIDLNSNLSSAWAGRGGARLRQGAAKEALVDLDQALSIEPENLFALRDRAEARLKTDDQDGALDDFNKKLQLAPGDGRALCGRGEVKLQKGDKEGALTDFQLAMRLSYPGADKMFKEAKAAK